MCLCDIQVHVYGCTYMLQCPDRTVFAPAALMLSCLGTAIDLLDIYRPMACMNWVT